MRCPRVGYFFPAFAAALVFAWLVLRPSPSADLAAAPPQPPAGKDAAGGKDLFAETVKPLFTKYCITCHNDKKHSGELSLERFTDTAGAAEDRDLWDKVKEYVGNREMPPKGKPQPTDSDRKAIVAWIDTMSDPTDCGLARNPAPHTPRPLH